MEHTMSTRSAASPASLCILILVAVVAVACGGKKAPVARPAPPPATGTTAAAAATAAPRPPAPPEPVAEPIVVPPEPVKDDTIASASLDDLNRNSPLKPVFFELDSSEVGAEGQAALNANAATLKKNATWSVTIEGHCDERGTPEYNLALGERRAVAARAYLVSLGIPADRLRTVSYGKEFPFDPGHDEAAWTKNRRAHFVITVK
jgi:peptidoglycan-associated lipoprotein